MLERALEDSHIDLGITDCRSLIMAVLEKVSCCGRMCLSAR